MNDLAYSRTIGAIYDAAVSFDRWPTALDQLAQVFGCNAISLVDRDLDTMQGRAVGIDPPSLHEYFGTWNERNIFNIRTSVYETGAIQTDRQILSKSDLLRSDYYNGFLKPRDMYSLLRISLRAEDRVHQSISLMRPRAAAEFQQSDVEVASLLLPHLQRAALIMKRLQEAGMFAGAAVALLEENPAGIVLLNHGGKVAFANGAAREMARVADSFCFREGRIKALREGDDAILQRLIAEAVGHSSSASAARGGPMRLPRKSGLRDYVLVVAPLYIASEASEEREPIACILISDPEAIPRRARSMLREVYGLTASEVRVAERMMTGESPERAAAALAIKVSTARVHLAALFRKTETHRQVDLVRLLMSLPWSDCGTKQKN
jgi:DNA-binding CsgD family transcriptional regulator